MEFFDIVRIQFAVAQVSLLDQEHDVSSLSIFNNALESIVSVWCVRAGSSRQFRSRDNAISDFHRRNSVWFLSFCNLEIKIKFRVCHFGNIVERSFHRVAATCLVSDSLIVSFYFFSLEYSRLAFSFATFPSQNRGNFNSCVLLEILLGEFTINCHRHFTTDCFKHFRVSCEIVRRQFSHLAAWWQGKDQ